MAKTNARDDYYFAVPAERLYSLTVRDLLDMLRYDRATVERDDNGVTVLRTTTGRYPTVRRWESFGVPVLNCAVVGGPHDLAAVAEVGRHELKSRTRWGQ